MNHNYYWDAMNNCSPVLMWVYMSRRKKGLSAFYYMDRGRPLPPVLRRQGKLKEIMIVRGRIAVYEQRLTAIMHAYPGTDRRDAIRLLEMWDKRINIVS